MHENEISSVIIVTEIVLQIRDLCVFTANFACKSFFFFKEFSHEKNYSVNFIFIDTCLCTD